jgi:TPR repeat protein
VGWFRLASEAGLSSGQVNLAIMLENGFGVERDMPAALALWRMAAEHGNNQAQTRLANAARDGAMGVPRDNVEAARLYRLAADAGWGDAQANLAGMLEDGIGGARDPEAALVLWRKAANQGVPFAMNRLGKAAMDGALGLPRDNAEAVRRFRQAADLGLDEGLANLALMLEHGWGADRDPDAALKLW